MESKDIKELRESEAFDMDYVRGIYDKFYEDGDPSNYYDILIDATTEKFESMDEVSRDIVFCIWGAVLDHFGFTITENQ